jgi:putative transposase
MPWSLQRYQKTGDVHFITFSCYRRRPLLRPASACQVFEVTLERVRAWYRMSINAYVVMPEHVHLLLHEPERKTLSVVIQMLKQIVGRKISKPDAEPFWERRYYDRNIRTVKEFDATMHYIHQNPVKRRLCSRPEDWRWSSFLHLATGIDGALEIESQWTSRRRERMGIVPIERVRMPHPPR